MDNYQIADTISLLAKLMEIHGENAFKIKSYTSAAFNIEKLNVQLATIEQAKIASIPGIGASTAQKVIELITTDRIEALESLIQKTPEGILEMLSIKGIGPKKINTIWKEMQIETVGELLYACKENRLKLYKGFGEKTQQNVIASIEFYFAHKGSHLYAAVLPVSNKIHDHLKELFTEKKVAVVGNVARQLEIVHQLEFVINDTLDNIIEKMHNIDFLQIKKTTGNQIELNTSEGLSVILYTIAANEFIPVIIQKSASEEFWLEMEKIEPSQIYFENELDYFLNKKIPFIPPYLREDPLIIEKIKTKGTIDTITNQDIKGIIHCHSNWSDGANTIEEIARKTQSMGLEYLVISDHSKAAFYAQGLSEEKILAQHQYIDTLNDQLYPFKIFKSIECDILSDGNLDYNDAVLSQFDLVIASVHSNLKMSEEKAMTRLLKAIENPFTTILGHLTGRLLLSRPGYPVDHKKIIDACAANHVAIELNAHPIRLDMDWRHIAYALEKNVIISINPDAHELSGLQDTQYGVLVAQKAMVARSQNLSSFTLTEFEDYLQKIKLIKKIKM